MCGPVKPQRPYPVPTLIQTSDPLLHGHRWSLVPGLQPALTDKENIGWQFQGWLRPGPKWFAALPLHMYSPSHNTWHKTGLLEVVSVSSQVVPLCHWTRTSHLTTEKYNFTVKVTLWDSCEKLTDIWCLGHSVYCKDGSIRFNCPYYNNEWTMLCNRGCLLCVLLLQLLFWQTLT